VCASFSTNNRINCSGCVASSELCSWCGTATTGSCHAASGTGAAALCTFLLNGQLLSGAAAAGQCINNTVPNYCPTYQKACECKADPDCVPCLGAQQTTANDCSVETRCVAKSEAAARCTANAAYNRSLLVTDALALNCATLPDTCPALDAVITAAATTAAAATTTAVGGSGGPSNSSSTTTGGALPDACDAISIVEECKTRCVTADKIDQCTCSGSNKIISCVAATTVATVTSTAATVAAASALFHTGLLIRWAL
jgi:hypothetical protein